jgi:hypothetical protein
MPWKASSVMDERTRFVLERERRLHTMTELREIYGIAREPEYGSDLRVRRVRPRGSFSWKQQEVFASETLIGETIGLLPVDDRIYTVYFAAFPIACFDSHRRTISPLRAASCQADAGEGEVSPSPAPHPLGAKESKVSGMCPV